MVSNGRRVMEDSIIAGIKYRFARIEVVVAKVKPCFSCNIVTRPGTRRMIKFTDIYVDDDVAKSKYMCRKCFDKTAELIKLIDKAEANVKHNSNLGARAI